METAREHGLQLNVASNKTEAVVDFRGNGRQQVLEDLSREFPVVDGQWTPTAKVEGVSLRLVSTYRQEDLESEAPLLKGRSGRRACGHWLSVALRGWYMAFLPCYGHQRHGAHVHGAFQDNCQ